MTAEPRGERALGLLGDLRAETARADGKAAVLVTVLGLLSGLLVGRDWSHARASAVGLTLLLAVGTSLTVSLLAMLLAIFPRYRASRWAPGEPLAFFGDVLRAQRAGLLDRALTDTEQAAGPALATSVAEIAVIAARKNRWIRIGTCAFALAAGLLPLLLLVSD
ncbi:Pycsar system effector family protein [Streptacidiphilus rugosus]|uniref:Pycsar system effector family protein n=1 Tax=Streptacidiphilus rugosus TaxID=405783 RepID=UPI00055E7B10|nr:Pycsar system effector family protein [Streptacidiphilus rugosus]